MFVGKLTKSTLSSYECRLLSKYDIKFNRWDGHYMYEDVDYDNEIVSSLLSKEFVEVDSNYVQKGPWSAWRISPFENFTLSCSSYNTYTNPLIICTPDKFTAEEILKYIKKEVHFYMYDLFKTLEENIDACNK